MHGFGMQRIGKLGLATTALALTLTLAGCQARDEEAVTEPDETAFGEDTGFDEAGTEVAFGEAEAEPVEPEEIASEAAGTPEATAPEASRPPAARPEPTRPEPTRPEATRPEPTPTRSAPAAEEPAPRRTEPAAPPPPAPAAPPAPAPPAAEPAGRQIFLAQNCHRCHSVSTADIEAKAKTGPTAGGDLSAITLGRSAMQTVVGERQLPEKRHPGRFTGTPGELDTLLDWLVTQRR